MDIKLIEVQPDGVVAFKLSPTIITGMEKLVQIVVLTLLDVPGRSVIHPEAGGAIPSLVGSNFDLQDSNEIFAEITRRVTATQAEIISNQLRTTDPANERLRELRIIDIRQGEDPGQVLVRLRVINEAGRQVDVIL